MLVSNTYHIPDIPVRLLCPQQVAQQSRDPLAGGCATKTDFLLAWDYNCKTINYDKHNNLHVLYITPGGTNASSYLAKSMEPFPSLYANRHSLLFATPHSDNQSISDELIPYLDHHYETDHQPINKRTKHTHSHEINPSKVDCNHRDNNKTE